MSGIVITELDEIEPERVDGVKSAANGFPVLLMKSIAKDGKGAQGWPAGDDDDWPAMTADTSREGPNGDTNDPEGCGCCDMCDGSSDCTCCDDCECGPETLLDSMTLDTWKSAAITYLKAEEDIYKRDFTEAKRKELAAKGWALKDGSYPIENEEDLHNAAGLAKSGHGDVAAAKRLIAKRAKELGVPNPLDEKKTEKSEVEKTEDIAKAAEITKAAWDEFVTKANAATEAIAELKKALEDRDATVKDLEARLAKVEETPVPGGPVLTAPASIRAQTAKNESLAKAAYWDRMADNATDAEERRDYRNRAETARGAAGVTST